MSKKNKKCPDCGKLIYNTSERCKSCSRIGALNSNFGNTGEKSKLFKNYHYFCIDCGNEIFSKKAKRCFECNKSYLNKLRTLKKENKIVKKYYCINCGKEIDKRGRSNIKEIN